MSGNPYDSSSLEANPFAAPQATDSVVVDADLTDAEAIRKEHLNRESSIRTLGLLSYIGAILLIPVSLIQGAGALGLGAENANVPLILCGIFLVLGVLSVALGRGFRTLSGWARPTGIVLQSLGLLSSVLTINPVGILINSYILWLLTGEKGKFVFSREYRAIREATPHVRKKTSIVIWIFLGLVLFVIVIGVFALLFSTRQ